MKDILFVFGRLTQFEKERCLGSITDQINCSGLSCDAVDSSRIRITLLNYYRGVIFVNVGFSDRVRRFIERGQLLNKTFFQLYNHFNYGGLGSSEGLLDLVDYNFKFSDNLTLEAKVNNLIEINSLYSEAFLSNFNLEKPYHERNGLFVWDEKIKPEEIRSLVESSISNICVVTEKRSFSWSRKVDLINPKELGRIVKAIKSSKYAHIGRVTTPEMEEFIKDCVVFAEVPAVDIREKRLLDEISVGKVLDSIEEQEIVKNLRRDKHNLTHSKSSVHNAYPMYELISKHLKPSIGINIPGAVVRGGVLVAIKHARFLSESGNDVTLISDTPTDNEQNVRIDDLELPVVALEKNKIQCKFDKLVATLWNTVDFVSRYPKVNDRYYLVQGFETDFSEHGNDYKSSANRTYFFENFKYVTISKWCKEWLENKYNRKSVRYAPNGLDIERFKKAERKPLRGRKFIILIEGNCLEPFRGIDEAFQITNSLDKEKFEIHYMSYVKAIKDWYEVDKTYYTVPHKDVPEVFSSSDLLLKCSELESFSLPPLEMMGTGGACVIASNEGNKAYAKNNENCIVYERGDREAAKAAIIQIYENDELRNSLGINGIKTAESYSWDKIKQEILDLYM